MLRKIQIAALALVTSLGSVTMAAEVDPALPKYEPAGNVSGSVKSVGSDTLNNLMTGWAEEFRRVYPNVTIEIEGKGSATAPPALIQGTSQLGPMSRPMKGSEIDDFKKKYGYAPTPVRVAVDALAVFVHKDNPIKSLSFEQIRQIFSVEGKDMTWGDLGLEGDWASKPISLYGRNAASGTYGFFKEHAMGKKDYKATVKEQPGSSAVVQAVATDLYGMGYSGIGYSTADVRAVPVALLKTGTPYEATADNAYSGDYPLSRFLLIYLNIKPGEAPSPIVSEFIKLVYSHQGQEVVVKDGYFPIVKRISDSDLKLIAATK